MNYAVAPSTQSDSATRRVYVTRTVHTPAPIELPGTPRVETFQASVAPREAAALEDPGEVYFIKGELPHGHWLHYAVPVRVRVEGPEYVAIQPQLALHAFGESPADAIYNLREELVEHYERLQELGDQLASPLRRQRTFLRKLLTSRDA